MIFTTKARVGLLALVAALVLTVPAHAQFIDFEGRPSGIRDDLIENGYMGFDWSNFASIGRGDYPASGADKSMHGNRAGFNGWGDPASISSSSTFDFYSAYIGAAWSDGLKVTVRGLLNGVLVFTQSLTAYTSGSQLVVFNFVGVNQLSFSASGGGFGTIFIIDDLTFNTPQTVTPEPVSMALLGTGLAGVAAARRRRKRANEA